MVRPRPGRGAARGVRLGRGQRIGCRAHGIRSDGCGAVFRRARTRPGRGAARGTRRLPHGKET